MTDEMPGGRPHHLPLDRRMAIFRTVVEMQDTGIDAGTARTLTAKRFDVDEEEVRQAEEEGMREEWPPLC